MAVTGLVQRQVGSRASLEQTSVSGKASRHRGNSRRPGRRRRSRCQRQAENTYRPGDGTDYISLSNLGLTNQNAYVGVDGHNTIIVDPRNSGANSYDIVYEFDPARDKIDVSHYLGAHNYTSAAQVLALAVNDGSGNVYFALGDGFDYLYLIGLQKADLNTGDFIV